MLVRQVAAIITCYWGDDCPHYVLAIIIVYTHSESPQQIIDPTLRIGIIISWGVSE